jgi:hypothetical protein
MGNAEWTFTHPSPGDFCLGPPLGLRRFHTGHIVAESGNPQRCGGRCSAERRGRGWVRHGRRRQYEKRSQDQREDQCVSNRGPRGGSYSVRTGPILSPPERLWQAKSHTSKRDASPRSHSAARRSPVYSPTQSPVNHYRDEALRLSRRGATSRFAPTACESPGRLRRAAAR